MNPAENLDDLSPQQLRELAATLQAQIQEQDAVIAYFGERVRRFRERDRFGEIGVARCRL